MTINDDLKRSVKETYNDIAPHFVETRGKVWPPTKLFIQEVAPCILGDLGCGTGRSILEAVSMGCKVIGLDSSEGQLSITNDLIKENGYEKDVELLLGDLVSPSIKDESFDSCIMIAALHHLPEKADRIRALNEAFRCTRSNGKIQISVWTWDQERFRDEHLSRMDGSREINESDGPNSGDFMVPWKKGTTAMRFYHLYGPGELEREIDDSEWTLVRSYFDGRNHWAECIKVP